MNISSNAIIRSAGLSAFVFFLSCSAPEDKKTDAPAATVVAPAPVLKSTDYLNFTADSVEIPSFEIQLSLSSKAEEKLKTAKETVIVAAYFSGIPKDTTSREYRKQGEVAISSIEKELAGERIAKFNGIRIPRKLYNTITEKSLAVLINVYSGRRSGKLNLLDCDIYQGPVSGIKGKEIVIKGKLINE